LKRYGTLWYGGICPVLSLVRLLLQVGTHIHTHILKQKPGTQIQILLYGGGNYRFSMPYGYGKRRKKKRQRRIRIETEIEPCVMALNFCIFCAAGGVIFHPILLTRHNFNQPRIVSKPPEHLKIVSTCDCLFVSLIF